MLSGSLKGAVAAATRTLAPATIAVDSAWIGVLMKPPVFCRNAIRSAFAKGFNALLLSLFGNPMSPGRTRCIGALPNLHSPKVPGGAWAFF